MNRSKLKLTVRDVTLIGLMVAIIEVCKAALAFAPNIETTSFWVIMFTLFFRKKILFVIPVFIVVEGIIYGIHLWWIMYLYVWFILAFTVWLFRKMDSAVGWAVLSGLFGLSFGFLCSAVYFFIGLPEGIGNAVRSAMGWWIAGIPWDMVHCAGNFVIMLVLYNPMKKVMQKAEKIVD